MPIELCHRITVRISPDAFVRLQAIASESQRTVSDVVRHAVEGLPVRPRRQSRSHDDLIRQLIRIGNNLNQQTRLLHLFKHRGDLPDLETLLATLEQVKGTLRLVSGRVKEEESGSDC